MLKGWVYKHNTKFFGGYQQEVKGIEKLFTG